MSFCAKLLDGQHWMKLDAAPGPADLKMTEIEEPDTCDADADPSKLVPLTGSHLFRRFSNVCMASASLSR